MSEMVDGVAVAIYIAWQKNFQELNPYMNIGIDWKSLPELSRDQCRQLAIAAITAMREPPQEIFIKGVVDRFSDGEPITIPRWRENFSSIIDECLK